MLPSAVPSRVTADPDGTVWLESEPAALRRRRTAAGGLAAAGAVAVALALVAGPPPLAVAAVVACALLGAVLLVAVARAGCRVASSPVGVSIVGHRAVHIGWEAVSGVHLAGPGSRPAGERPPGSPRRGGCGVRRRVVVRAGADRHESPAGFQPQPARQWLARCAAGAAAAGLEVEATGRDGFRARKPAGR